MRRGIKKQKNIENKILNYVILIIILIMTLSLMMIKNIPLIPQYFSLDKNNTFKVNLYSKNAILVSLEDEKILAEKNINDRIYPASLTKIMTAIVAINNLKDLHEKIILPSDIFNNLYAKNASMAGFLPNEEVEAIDLLYGSILPSGAECCISLADYISGSEENFTNLMNEKAKDIGMENTHFTNTTGLQDKNHYTTVKDIAILIEYALKNQIFRQIFTSSDHLTNSTNFHADGLYFTSTLFDNMSNSTIYEGEILGGKTGYTEEAGLCLASLAIENGREYILVTAGAKGNHKTNQYNIEDAFLAYNSL